LRRVDDRRLLLYTGRMDPVPRLEARSDRWPGRRPRHRPRGHGDDLPRRRLRPQGPRLGVAVRYRHEGGVMQTAEPIVYRAGQGAASGAAAADQIPTEVIRPGLNSAAEQMKRALVRTAFSPVIYEVLDFAVAIYDDQVRLLAQAPSLPLFMGTMNFCVQAAVEGAGGVEALEPGDIILYNYPYGTGSHPQDAAVVMPVFLHDDELIGYATIKGHWLDIGGKEPYSTDTVDVFQEGTIFPGVKLYSRGTLVKDIYRMALANSRVPKMVAGDINAEVVGVRTAAAALL